MEKNFVARASKVVNGSLAKAGAVVAGAAASVMASPAMAEAVDVTTVVTDIKAQLASIALVGAAVLGVYAGVKAFKWIRAAMS